MQRLLLLSFALFSIVQIYAQQPLAGLDQFDENGRWVNFETDVRLTPSAYLSTYKEALGMSEEDGFERLHEEKDKLGFVHSRFVQQHNGIPVEGAHYLVHEQNGKIIRSNGNLVTDIYASPIPKISAEEAIASALLYTDANRYYWQDPHKEALIKRIERNSSATFYPSPELVFADKDYTRDGTNYRLAWKMEVFAEGPKGNKEIFVDAKDGHILYELEGCQDVTVDGVAETRYSGTQTFQTDSVAPGVYRLHDHSRLAAIETYNMRTITSGSIPDSAVDFTDDDNYWDNANDQLDDAATDVHWGMQQTYDYFYHVHDRISFDGDTAPIISYVHVGQNWFNARWTGRWAEFGDGNNNPLTSLDVVSHELTHGVTRNSANLVYRNESGALNESFSDIFGTTVERFAVEDSADWDIGEDNFLLRSMSDPKAYGDPDTYHGVNWWFDEGDNGGVHTNSGVQNFWFYLLTEGGSGTNDNGDVYQLSGLGMDTAAAIAYRNLSTYLTVNSTYADARYGAILSAEDLYGPCSDAVFQTIHAWYAVGVGPDMVVDDLAIEDPQTPAPYSCSYSTQEQISLDILYRRTGCMNGIPAGTPIPIGYTLNNAPAVIDTLILAQDLLEGDTIHYTFQSPVDLSQPAYYDFDFFATFDGDQNPDNDELPTFTVISVSTIDANHMIQFNEFVRPLIPSYFAEVNEHSIAMTSRDAAASGLRGFLMTGNNVQQNNIDYATNEEENFSKNQDYESRLCMCIDATSWDSLAIAFDLRQGYSEIYESVAPDVEDVHLGIALRLIADEVAVSQQFHPNEVPDFVPDSIDIDTFVRHTIRLDQLAGTSFNLCFQGKHFVNKTDDFLNSGGDYSHIDNIEIITGLTNVGTTQPGLPSNTVQLYPNPVVDEITVIWSNKDLRPDGWRITDMTGRIIQEDQDISTDSWSIQMTNYHSGIYFIEVFSDDQRVIKKVMKQ